MAKTIVRPIMTDQEVREMNRRLVQRLAEVLRQRGRVTRLDERGAYLSHVDDTFVGVWVCPKKNIRAKPTFTLRVGFSDNLGEFNDPHSVEPGVLADWILGWLAQHGQASRDRERNSVAIMEDE